MQIKTSHNTLNIGLTVERLYQELDERFPTVNPHPKEEIEAIMYKAGQRSIVEWIENRIKDEVL